MTIQKAFERTELYLTIQGRWNEACKGWFDLYDPQTKAEIFKRLFPDYDKISYHTIIIHIN